jgi:hypothetical protein
MVFLPSDRNPKALALAQTTTKGPAMRSTAVLLLLATPAMAQDPAWPKEIASIIAEDKTYCDGEFSMAPEAVTQRDLNGDGTLDWVLDTSGFSCSTSTGLYCGTGGCGVETLINGTLGSLLLHSWDTVTEGGVTYLTAPNDQGGTARFLWTDNGWQLQ